jgi:hypothetical protein
LKYKGAQYCGSCPLRSGACCHLKDEESCRLEIHSADIIPVACPHICCETGGIGYLNYKILLRSNSRGSIFLIVLTALSWSWKCANRIVGENAVSDFRLIGGLTGNISTWLREQCFNIDNCPLSRQNWNFLPDGHEK